ncbi:MAG: chitobiase/beta-hexosaminidase C-terminal domain-containing protein [Desulfuromonadales bacterium]
MQLLRILIVLAVIACSPCLAIFAATSENHELLLGQFNYGSGVRTSENYAFQYDKINLSIGSGASTSPDYAMQSGLVEMNPSAGSAPTGSVQTGRYTKSINAPLALTCQSTNGCTQMKFSNDNITWSDAETFATTKIWPLTTGDGKKIIFARFKDTLGTWSQVYSTDTILDTVVPTAIITPSSGLYSASQQITVSPSEAATIFYTLDGSPPSTSSAVYTAPLTLQSDATVNVLVVDPAGNQSAATQSYQFCLNTDGSLCVGRSTNYKTPGANFNYGGKPGYSTNYTISKAIINAQPVGVSNSANYTVQAEALDSGTGNLPACGVIINKDSLSTNVGTVELGLICSAVQIPNSVNSCTDVAISNNGYSWASVAPNISPRPYATSTTWPLPSNDGEKRVYVKFKDSQGNWSLPCSDSITLDTKSPVVTASPVGGTFINAQTVTLTAGENSTIYYSIDGSTPTSASLIYKTPISIAADTTLKYMAVDKTGNAGQVGQQVYVICDGSNFTIIGYVWDSIADAPIANATVTLSNGQTIVSDGNGVYAFSGLAKGYYTITSVKPISGGYANYQKEQLLCKNTTDNQIRLDAVLSKNNTVFGLNAKSGYSAHGVNTSTGNFAWSETDFEIPGRGLSFEFKRGYNSQDNTTGILGYGWNHSLNASLVEESATVVTARWGDGNTETWTWDNAKSAYVPRYGVFSKLTKISNLYTVTMKDMTRYVFNASKQLDSIIDDNNNSVHLTWNGSNLESVTDTVGRIISFAYDTNTPINRLTRITDPISRSVVFNYDGSGNMVSSTDTGGNVTTYTYDANHQILTITDARGSVVATNSYDDLRRVVSSQRDALGAQTLYSYDEAKKNTKIVDPYGNISYHFFDDKLRLIKETDSRNFSAQYVYNTRGNLTEFTDKRGNVTKYTYEVVATVENDNIAKKEEPLGKTTETTYDANNNPLTKKDAKGYITTYTYEGGNLKSVKNPDTPTGQYFLVNDYDQFGQLIKVTDAKGNITRNAYDVYGNKVSVIDALGNESNTYYDLIGRKTTEARPFGRGMLYEYDANGLPVRVTDALGGTTVFTYDANGNKTAQQDARGYSTLFAYDAKDHLISRTLPMGEVEQYIWDLMDRQVGVKNAMGATSSKIYDPLGNVLQEIDALGNKVSHEYDANGNRLKSTDSRGNATTFVYDELNRLKEKSNPLRQKETYTYDLNGNRLTVTNHLNETVTSTYDVMNRLKTVADHRGNTITNDYDEVGRLVKVADAKQNPTSFEYDAVGRLVKVTDAEGGIVTAQYDALGNRTAVTMSNKLPSGEIRQQTTTYTYDVLNRLTNESSQLGSKGLAYDAVGNVISMSDVTGTTTLSYDQDNRVTGKNYPTGGTVAYEYDANGNRTKTTDSLGNITYTYDKLDRISEITDPFGNAIGYSWDANRNRTAIKYPGSREVYYTYDSLNRLSRVQDWSGTATTYSYDAAGRLAGQIMGNGATVAYSYDNAGRLTGKDDKTATGTTIASYSYGLDANGNRESMVMNQPLVPKPAISSTTFTYDSANRILTGGGATYSHDGKGNRTAKAVGAITSQYAYNQEDRLTQVRTNSALQQEYRYDSSGRRFASVENGVETRYLLDLAGGMETVLAEMTTGGAVKKYYIHGDGLLYSVDGTTNERLYYHYDPLGSTVAITNAGGTVTDKYAYTPFGELNRSETAHDNRFTYVGKYGVMQEPNGLYFMRARFYDPETKRFMGVDPLRGDFTASQSQAPYGYVQNNPLIFIDPKGLFITDYLSGPEGKLISLGDLDSTSSVVDTISKGNPDEIGDAIVNSFNLYGFIDSIQEGSLDAVSGNKSKDKQDPFYQLSYAFQKIINPFTDLVDHIDWSKLSFGNNGPAKKTSNVSNNLDKSINSTNNVTSQMKTPTSIPKNIDNNPTASINSGGSKTKIWYDTVKDTHGGFVLIKYTKSNGVKTAAIERRWNNSKKK